MAHKVFVSASHKDRDLARDLEHRLHEAGLQVQFSDLNVSVGSNWEKRILDVLKTADEVMVILSNNSVDSPWLMFEIGAASSLRKKVTPVVVGLEEEELPPIIKQFKQVRYNELSDYISRLERSAQAA